MQITDVNLSEYTDIGLVASCGVSVLPDRHTKFCCEKCETCEVMYKMYTVTFDMNVNII